MLKNDCESKLNFKFALLLAGISIIVLIDKKIPKLSATELNQDTHQEVSNEEITTYRLNFQMKEENKLITENELIEELKYSFVIDVKDVNMSESSTSLIVDETKVVKLDETNYRLVELLVMGEAEGEGYRGQKLVAQCIRDTMQLYNIYDLKEIKTEFKYSGSLDKAPIDSVKQAVKDVFEYGDSGVDGRVIYFYSPDGVEGGVSSWHESQEFILEYKGHRFFDEVRK